MVSVHLVTSKIVEEFARKEFPNWKVTGIAFGGSTFGTGLISSGLRVRGCLSRLAAEVVVSCRYHPSLFEAIALFQIPRGRSVSLSQGPLGHRLPKFLERLLRRSDVQAYPVKTHAGLCLEIEAHRVIAEAILCRPVEVEDVIPKIQLLALRASGDILVLPHGSAAIRSYPINLLARAVSDAVKGTGIRVQLCGEINRIRELEDLKAHLEADLIDAEIVYPRTLLSFFQTVAKASVIVSMESAGAHIAAALDKPLVAIVGGGHFGYFAPWQRSSRQRWLHEPLDCYGCNWKCRQPYPKCIHDISPDRVSFEIRSLIAELRVN